MLECHEMQSRSYILNEILGKDALKQARMEEASFYRRKFEQKYEG